MSKKNLDALILVLKKLQQLWKEVLKPTKWACRMNAKKVRNSALEDI